MPRCILERFLRYVHKVADDGCWLWKGGKHGKGYGLFWFGRGNGPTAVNSRRTHCFHGHALSGANLCINKRGRRACRACSNSKRRNT